MKCKVCDINLEAVDDLFMCLDCGEYCHSGCGDYNRKLCHNCNDVKPEVVIDRKFIIKAVNPCNDNTYTELNSVLFCAKDAIFLEYALPAYLKGCIEKGCEPNHIKSVELLIERVSVFQSSDCKKLPDTDLACEVERCIEGKL